MLEEMASDFLLLFVHDLMLLKLKKNCFVIIVLVFISDRSDSQIAGFGFGTRPLLKHKWNLGVCN